MLLTALAACSSGGGGGGAPASGSSSARFQSIAITPSNPHVAAGTTTQLTVTAILSNSSHQDVTSQVTWGSSNTQTATVSNGVAKGLSAGSSSISATMGAMKTQTTLTVTPAVLVSIELTPPRPSAAKGTTTQFTATGVFSDKSTQNLTSQVAWVSSNPAVATISSAPGSAGLATAAGAGSANITASLNGVTSPAASLTVTAATLVSIQVTPPSPSIANGLSEQFTATGVYTDNSTQDLTSMVSWVSSNGGVAAFSTTGGPAGLATSAGMGSTNISASFGAITSPPVSLTVTPATLVSIQVTPPSPSIANGLSEQFTATGVYSDNSKQDLTSVVAWSSSNSSVAGISSASGSYGLATSAGVGTSNITAASGSIVSPAVTLTVTPAALVSIQVDPPIPSIANGLTQQFTATGHYTDNSTQDLTAAVTWFSDTMAVATISSASGSYGLATSAGVGTSNITAASGNIVSPPVTLTVTPAALVSIQVSPPIPSIAHGLTEQFTATGTYTDNSTQDLTAAVTWASDTMAVATISSAAGSNGLATSAGIGTSNITAISGNIVSPPVTLTVTPAALVSIQVNPPIPSIANGLTQQFTATGTYTDNSTQDLTAAVTWFSDTMAVATISSASGSYGLATSAGIGTSNITAASGSIFSPAVTLTVTPAELVSIQVDPPSPSIAKGLTQQFAATGIYTDNTKQDLTAVVTWGSSNSSAASISNAGLATALAVGTSSITATSGVVSSPAATLAVTPASLVSIQVDPPMPSIANGLTQQFTATGLYTDNSTQDLTAAVTWFSDTMAVATISSAAGSNGLATSAGIGTSNITAASGNVVSPPVTLNVTPATLVSIQVNPPSPSIAKGLTQQFTATGIYTDNTTQDLTADVTWAANGGAASISNATGYNGLATALAVGTSSITATSGAVSSPAATLTVTAAALVSIQVLPSTATIAKGLAQQFSAIGTYTDNSTQDLTTAVTWVSSAGSVASITNGTSSSGLATGLGIGPTNISASYGAVTSPNASLTVTAAALVSIAVTPTSPTIAQLTTQQFAATGTYTDSSTQDLTTVVTWASSTGGVASISNAAGSKGLATAVGGVGSSNISAAFTGVTSPSAVLTVVAPTTMAGIWTATPAPGMTAFMISDAAGNVYYYTSTATCMALWDTTLTLTGTAVAGTGYYTADVFGPRSGCTAQVHEQFTGTLAQQESMQLTSTRVGGGGSSLTIDWAFDSIYSQPSAQSLVAGTWTMADGTTVTVSGTGVIAAHDTTTGCTITGQVSVSNTAVNEYNVTARYTGCTGAAGALNGASLSGLGMLDTSVMPSQFTALVRSANLKTMSILTWAQ